MTASHAIGVDVGGTQVKIGLVDRELRIVARDNRPTGDQCEPSKVILSICDAICALLAEKLPSGAAVGGVGIGTPGPMSPSRGVVLASPNMPKWRDVALRDRIADGVGLNVVMDNDANVAAYAEYRCQTEPKASDLVVLTLGTGVGSGTVLNGRVLHGHFENASEWGHVIVQPGGRECGCGQRGCLEQYASAGGVVRRVEEEIRGGAMSSLSERVLASEAIDASDVAAAARGSDALSGRIWDEACHYLALACVNIQHAVNPQRILLGGGMSEAGGFLLDTVRRHFESLRWQLCDDAPTIELARIGNDAGIVGAAAMMLDSHDRLTS